MGWQWVNNTYSPPPPPPPPLPVPPDVLFVFLILTSVVTIVVMAYGVIWAIEAFFDWLASKIADKVVQKLKEKEADTQCP